MKRHCNAVLLMLSAACWIPPLTYGQTSPPDASAPSASAQPASDASIEELLAITRAKEQIDNYLNTIGPLMMEQLAKGLQGKKPTPDQSAFMREVGERLTALIQSRLSWDALHSHIVAIYKADFSEAEVRSIIELYRTPTGQMMLAKLPQVLQQTQRYALDIQSSLMPEIRKIVVETAAKYPALDAGEHPASAAPVPAK